MAVIRNTLHREDDIVSECVFLNVQPNASGYDEQPSMATTATTSVEPWVAALHAGSARLADTATMLSDEELSRPSFAAERSIAQVLPRLGSRAEICTDLLAGSGAGQDRSIPRRSSRCSRTPQVR